jgi:hypothetical protein
MNIKIIAITVGAAALLSACATVRPASPDELAYCQKMADQMGTGTTHDHGEMKGAPANPMNVSHARCQQIMATKQ